MAVGKAELCTWVVSAGTAYALTHPTPTANTQYTMTHEKEAGKSMPLAAFPLG